MPIFYTPDITSGYLPPDESRHAAKVLRLNEGDSIELTDGRGNLCRASITRPDAAKCSFQVTQKTVIERRAFNIHLGIAPTKNSDRMEWMVEKCVELGIEEISFIQCKSSERKSINIERMEKIAVSAIKQSRQAWLPAFREMIPLEKFIAQRPEKFKFIAHVDETNAVTLKDKGKANSQYVVLVGPEGDFSKDELNAALGSGFEKVSLGPTRLRTETAGLAAVMTLNLLNLG